MSDEERSDVRTGRFGRAVASADDEAVVSMGLTKEQAAGILSGDAKFANLAEQVLEERNKRLAPAGSLSLPPLLDARRLEYAIPDSVFEMQALFDKVLVYQVPEDKDLERYGDTSIIRPESHQSRRKAESPMGILCGAGLKAMDVLKSNGICLGHKVAIVKLSPWRKEVESVLGHGNEMLICLVGDLIGSLDLADAMTRGEVSVRWSDDHRCHLYVDSSGNEWFPQMPETAPEV